MNINSSYRALTLYEEKKLKIQEEGKMLKGNLRKLLNG